MQYMNDKVKKLLENSRGKKVGIFIDSANWFYPQKELGWRVSFSKLLALLGEYFEIKVVKIYAGTPLLEKNRVSFDRFCQAVQKSGCFIVTKPLKKIWLDRNKGIFVHKCNFDVEIAFDIARSVEGLDMIIIGSGDSDFLEVKNFVIENKKSFMVLCFERGVAWEMRKLHHIFLEDLKNIIKQNKMEQK